MARTNLAVQQIERSGLEATYSAANVDGHAIANNGATTFLHVKNGAGGDITVTSVITRTVDGVTPAGKTCTVTAGEDRFIGPWPKDDYNQQSGADAGKVYVNFSAVASVTVAALQL